VPICASLHAMMADVRTPTNMVLIEDVTAQFLGNFKSETNVNRMWMRVKKFHRVRTTASVSHRWGIGIAIAQIIITE